MSLEKKLLLTTERLELVSAGNPPATQGLTCRFMAPDQLARGVEADPVAIKQFVDMRWGSPDSEDSDQGFTGVSVEVAMNLCSQSIGLM